MGFVAHVLNLLHNLKVHVIIKFNQLLFIPFEELLDKVKHGNELRLMVEGDHV